MLCQCIRVTFLVDDFVPGLLEKAKYLLAEARTLESYPLSNVAVARRLRGEKLIPVAEIVHIKQDFSRGMVSERMQDLDAMVPLDRRFEVHITAGVLPGVSSNNLFQSMLIDVLFKQVTHMPIQAETLEREIVIGQ